jgi:hypothetical protein
MLCMHEANAALADCSRAASPLAVLVTAVLEPAFECPCELESAITSPAIPTTGRIVPSRNHVIDTGFASGFG